MSTNSDIEWTDATWNPLLGCSRVSPGCDRCYAITTATIRAGNPHPKVAAAFEGLTERRDGRLDWTGRVNLLPERLTQPLRWKKPRLVFVNSQADLFHDQVSDDYIAKVFAVMALAPQHTFQVLTKRHARMRSLLSSTDFKAVVALSALEFDDAILGGAWPLRNVWMGVSVEDQRWADIRIPALIDTPAAVRFLSCEPLLGPVDLDPYIGPIVLRKGDCGRFGTQWTVQGELIDWVIVGGESGSDARPMHPDWARGLRDQCKAAGVPFFLKQWGEWAPTGERGIGYFDPKCELLVGERLDDVGHREIIARVGKKTAGRELDGRTWDEMPALAGSVTS